MMKKRLYKDQTDKKLCGVCSALPNISTWIPPLSAWRWCCSAFWAAAVF